MVGEDSIRVTARAVAASTSAYPDRSLDMVLGRLSKTINASRRDRFSFERFYEIGMVSIL
jgi:hypothetical protein